MIKHPFVLRTHPLSPNSSIADYEGTLGLVTEQGLRNRQIDIDAMPICECKPVVVIRNPSQYRPLSQIR